MIKANLETIKNIKVGTLAKYKSRGNMFPEATYEGIITDVRKDSLTFWGLPIKETMNSANKMESGLLGSARRIPTRACIMFNDISDEGVSLWYDEESHGDKSVKNVVEYTCKFLLDVINTDKKHYDYKRIYDSEYSYCKDEKEAKEMTNRAKQNDEFYIMNVFNSLTLALNYKGNLIKDYWLYIQKIYDVMGSVGENYDKETEERAS